MRAALLLPALVGLAVAVPMPQDLGTDIDLADIAQVLAEAVATQELAPPIEALSAAPTYNTVVAASSAAAEATELAAAAAAAAAAGAGVVDKRGLVVVPTTTATTCKPQPTGYGPAITSPDSASAFTAAAQLHSSATAAAVPTGYSQAFSDLNGSTQEIGYIGLYTLQAYDPSLCAAKCDKVKQCMAFNIYFERDPTVNPDSPNCADPPSTTNIKCTLYGYPVVASTATNTGQYRNGFQVVIAGSNGYVKTITPSSLTNFTGPVSFGNAAINSPDNSYIRYQQFTSPYDPSLCAAACQAMTQYDATHLAPGHNDYVPCNFFNVWIILKNGAPQGQICSFYSKPWGVEQATNYGDPVNYVTITESFGYTLTKQDPGVVAY